MRSFTQSKLSLVCRLVLLIGTIAAAAEASAVECVTVVSSYSGTTDLACPGNYVTLSGSCDGGIGTVIVDSTAAPPPLTDKRVWYLTPSASRATGLHCELPGKSQAQLRCCR